MFNPDKKKFDEALQRVVEEEKLIETLKTKYGVARPVSRKLITEFGVKSPRIIEELRKQGYPLPAKGE